MSVRTSTNNGQVQCADAKATDPPLTRANQRLEQAMVDLAQVGIAATTAKQAWLGLANQVRGRKSQLQFLQADHFALDALPDVLLLEQQVLDLEAAFHQAQSRRVRAEHAAELARDEWLVLGAEASREVARWIQAIRIVEHDANAMARYQARISASTAQHALEMIVGEDEARSVLYQGERPEWLRKR